jgi:hypothetical protein
LVSPAMQTHWRPFYGIGLCDAQRRERRFACPLAGRFLTNPILIMAAW